MPSVEAFPPFTQAGDLGPLSDCSGIDSSEWYTASTTYPYNEQYMTTYPTSTLESQAWPQFCRTSVPNISISAPSLDPLFTNIQTQVGKDPSRPRSSPSTFGPGAEQITWPTSYGLNHFSSVAGQPTPPVTSTFPPSVFQTYQSDEPYAPSTPPEIQQPVPKRPFPTLAPNPEQVAAQKRKRDEEDQQQQEIGLSSSKKRKRTSSVASGDLSEDDRFLVQLKEKEELPWKDIANRFQTDMGKSFQVAALQMRYKRLREKFRIWAEDDVKALKAAHEYWEKYKWDIIASKMIDFGINERWPARQCARKWQELQATATTMPPAMGATPALSHYSSPPGGESMGFAWMPLP